MAIRGRNGRGQIAGVCAGGGLDAREREAEAGREEGPGPGGSRFAR